MARLINTEKGFKVIEMAPEEARQLGWGVAEGCVCTFCNKIINGTIYYVPALRDTMDKECYDDWYKDAVYYPEDAKTEQADIDLCFSGKITIEQ